MKGNQVEPIIVQENYRTDGELKSIYQYIDKDRDKKKCLVPRWCFMTASLCCLAILLTLAAALVAYFYPRPGLHTESCAKRSCQNGLGLKCINNTCLCETDYVYINKCILKKNYMEKCSSSLYCKDNHNMVCIDGYCKCNDTKYYDGSKCVDKGTYGKTCSNNGQCLEKLFLICKQGQCVCDNATRYWDLSSCYPKRTYNEPCSLTSNCRDWENLKCINKICQCSSNEFWDTSYRYCINKFYENVTCIGSYQCYTPMNCTNNTICQCGSYEYHNLTSLTCEPQKIYNETCEVDYNCRVDKYLECRNGLCQCISLYPHWSSGFNKCIVPVTYNKLCIDPTDCDGSKLLTCQNGAFNCSCPVAMPINKCDCVREYNNEYYWNGVTCVNARGYNQTCTNSSSTYMCKTLTEGTVCIGPYPYRCKCKTLQYFNNDQNYCLNQVSESGLCTQKDACRIDLGLSCQGGVCKCNGSIQYWNGLKCVNLLTYNQGTCANDNQCKGNLICKTSGSCNCPLNVVSTHCDCPNRVSGSEYYWNGYDCVLAGVYGQSCNSANYSCQYLTQKTQCDGSTLKCTCGPSGAWNGATCVFCDNGWYSVRGSCFKAISIPANVNTPSQIVSLCGNSNARLAILYRIDLSWLVYLSYTEQNNYFDSSYNFTSASPKCNVFDNSILNFDIHGCLHAHGMICEYVLYNNP